MEHLTPVQFWSLVDRDLPDTERQTWLVHLQNCPQCTQAYRSAEYLVSDLKAMPAPEVPAGFAARVSFKVKEQEIEHTFHQPSFKIFKYAIAASGMLILATLIFLSRDTTITLPELSLPGAIYWLPASALILAVWWLDRLPLVGPGKKM